MPELELEPDSHVYRLDGVVIPGCTQVLAAMGATPGFQWLTPDQLEFYRSRGHAIHKAIELHIKGTLDKRTIVDEVNPYLIGWDRFCADYEVLPFLQGPMKEPFTEQPLHHPVYRYGVTPDVVAWVNDVASVIEVKATSAHAPATGLQLAAQWLAVKTVLADYTKYHRIGLRLLQDEPYYDLKYYTERSDEAVWLSLLNGYNWLRKHKLLRETP